MAVAKYGGIIDLILPTLAGLSLQANSGTTGGNGGVVDVSATGSSGISLQSVSANALGSSGDGGTIDLASGSSSSAGGLFIGGSVTASAGDGGKSGSGGFITLSCNSMGSFDLESTLKSNTNGVTGTTAAAGTGGTLNVTNFSQEIIAHSARLIR